MKKGKKYDKCAAFYEKSMFWLNYASSMQDFLYSLKIELPKKPIILDLGCGTGISTTTINKKYPYAKIFALDISPSMLSICYKKFPQILLIRGDYNNPRSFYKFPEELPFKFQISSFDLIISTGSLSEYGKLEKVLPYLNGLLKPSGKLLNIGIKKSLVMWLPIKFWGGKMQGEKRFIKYCKKANFRNIQRITIPYRFFPTSFLKFTVLTEKKIYFSHYCHTDSARTDNKV